MSAPGERATRVLVVDDEPQLLRALGINLRARHYDVATAATGAQALDVVEQRLDQRQLHLAGCQAHAPGALRRVG